MPFNKKLYPPDWETIRAKIINRSEGKCELCFAPNGEIIERTTSKVYPWSIAKMEGDGADYPKLTKVVLTVHHIDFVKSNNHLLNLIALCQRCHLRLDLLKHVENRQARRGGCQQVLGV